MRAYLALCVTVFMIAMLLMWLVIWLPVRLFGEKGRWLSHQGFRFWGASQFFVGLRIKIIGRQNLVQQGPVLYIANHQSLFDTIALFWTIHRPIRVLAKAELGRLPILGPLFTTGSILVQREESGSRTASLAAMMRHFSAGGSLLLFPEGRMNKNPPALLPFSDTGIRIAMRYKLALQPIALQNSGWLLPATGPFLVYPGTLTVEVGPPILPQEYATLTPEEVTQRMHTWMAARVGEK